MPNAYISGTGMYVPPRVVTNTELAQQYDIDTTDEWIQKRTGIKERRFADEGVGASDLALKASEQAIEAARVDKTDLDMIIFCTLSPDCHFPGSGVYLQTKMGLCDAGKFVPALDMLEAAHDQKISIDDIDLLFFHQANLRINQYIQEQMKAPADKFPHNIERFGNTTAATIPTLLDEAVRGGKLKPGMKIACVAFGSGFTWGCTIIDW